VRLHWNRCTSVIAGFVLMIVTGTAAVSAAAASAPAATPAAAITATAEKEPTRQQQLPFSALGVAGNLKLRGVDGLGDVSFGTRLDEVVVAATLHLRYAYSPGLLPDISHIKLMLNDQLVTTLPLPHDKAGTEQSLDIPLDPRLFVDYNHLRFQLIGHYALTCEDAMNSTLWANISDQSQLDLTLRPVALAPDLSTLPAPFFDRRDGRHLTLPVVLPPSPGLGTVRAAAVAASWFGALASYRGASFPVSTDGLPDRDALVFATNTAMPVGLDLAPVQAPTVSVMAKPGDPYTLLLVLQGKDAAQLLQAAQALALGQVVLTGSHATITALHLGKPRAAYDAPNWVPSDRPVKFGELVDNPQRLEVFGHEPDPITVNLRLPPDLLTWNRAGVPVSLNYRYTPPLKEDNSTFTVLINGQLARSVHLLPNNDADSSRRLTVPLLGSDAGSLQERFLLPAFQIGADNQMQFRFVMDYHKSGQCTDTLSNSVRAGLEPDSTIDLSGFPHYVRMPDLALYANAGWPFTKYADLSHTAVVLPAHPGIDAIQTTLQLLARMGAQTGAPALRVSVIDTAAVQRYADDDLLVIGNDHGDGLLTRWASRLPLQLTAQTRSISDLAAARVVPRALLYGAAGPAAAGVHLAVRDQGDLSALLGFRSPLNERRSVVALTSTTPVAAAALRDALIDPAKVGQIHGDTVLLRGDHLASFDAERPYYVGHLPLWTRIWLWLSARPWLVILLGVAAGLLLALWFYARLQRAAQRRLDR